LDIKFNEQRIKGKARKSGIEGSTEVDGDVRERFGRALYDAVFRATCSSSLRFIDPLCYIRLHNGGRPVSSERRKLSLLVLRCSISMPRHACRATASPLILRLRLWFKLPVRISMPDRTFGALLLRTAPPAPFASGPSPSRLRTSDAINDETGMTRCLAMKSMHFIDRCFPVAAASRPFIGSD
jgi:hypothetical protein